MVSSPFRVLGLHDAHDSGVVLLEDGHIIYAANEERFSRHKLHWGFPHLSLKNLFAVSGISPAGIHAVAVSGRTTFEDWSSFTFDPARMVFFRRYAQPVADLLGPLTDTKAFAGFVRGVGRLQRRPRPGRVAAMLRGYGITAPVRFYDHHTCHAAGAFFTAPVDPVLIITADGSGDGITGTVSVGRSGALTRMAWSSVIHSAGRFWDVMTHLCGFTPIRHAGKITGLAAYKPTPEAHERLGALYGGSARRLRFDNKERRIWSEERRRITEVLPGASREELAYAAQKVLEDAFTTVVRAAVERTGIRAIALAGGTFANVRLNQKLAEISGVDSVHIFPNMGDGGLALGAAFLETARHVPLRPAPLTQLYFGPSYAESDLHAAARELDAALDPVADLADAIASELQAERVVAVYQGRMEFGPRALGHRSILAEPTDVTMMDWLNRRLERTEFMPFAPMILEEAAPRYFRNFAKSAYGAKFMTMCFDVTEEGRRRAPGIVHRDGTARPQTVSRTEQPLLHAALRLYEERTGLPLCVNTSFNKHEEPIVCTPQDAIREFHRGGTDTLFLERFRVRRPGNPKKEASSP